MATFKGFNRRLTCLLIMAVLLVLSGCQGCGSMASVERFRKSSDPYQGSPYQVALSQWTREARIYQGLDVKLIASATYKSPAFRQAYIAEYARAYALTDARKTRLEKDHQAAAGMFNDFILAAYVPEKDWDNFSRRDSAWSMFIITGSGKQVLPVEIRKIKKPDTVFTHFFPYATPWKSIYLVRFPMQVTGTREPVINDDADGTKLVITSVLGKTEMVWSRNAAGNRPSTKTVQP